MMLKMKGGKEVNSKNNKSELSCFLTTAKCAIEGRQKILFLICWWFLYTCANKFSTVCMYMDLAIHGIYIYIYIYIFLTAKRFHN